MFSPSKLILGTVQFGLDYGINNSGGQLSEKVAHEVLSSAVDGGVRYLDTAAGYGSSEKVIGGFMTNQNDTPFDVITKLSATSGDGWKKSLELSLERLQISNLDTILFHSFQHYEQNVSHLPEFQTCIDEGLIKKVGVSVYTNEELMKLVEAPNISVVQAPFNLLDNGGKRADAFEALKSAGKEIHTRSVFLQGLFFKKFDTFPHMLRELIDPLTKLDVLCRENGISKAELALCYPLSKKYIDKVLIGVDSIVQLEANLAILKNPVSTSLLTQVDEQINVQNTDLLNPSLWRR